MWELNRKESWGPKNWCFWTVMLEKTLESPLDCKEIQPVHSKGNQSWIGRTDAEAETNTLASWREELTHWKRPWCWERLKAGGEGVDRGWDGWMASLTQWTWVWVDSGSWWWKGGLAWCSPCGCRESDMSERLNRTEHVCILINPYHGSIFMTIIHTCFVARLWITQKSAVKRNNTQSLEHL